SRGPQLDQCNAALVIVHVERAPLEIGRRVRALAIDLVWTEVDALLDRAGLIDDDLAHALAGGIVRTIHFARSRAGSERGVLELIVVVPVELRQVGHLEHIAGSVRHAVGAHYAADGRREETVRGGVQLICARPDPLEDPGRRAGYHRRVVHHREQVADGVV